MERQLSSEPTSQDQLGGSKPESAQTYPVILPPDKMRRQIRVLRTSTAAIRNNCEEPRKTPGDRTAILRAQGLKYSRDQEVIGAQFAAYTDSSGDESIFNDSNDTPIVNFDPQVLAVFEEGQSKVQVGYHHLETTHFPSSPHAPRDILEEDYSEESRP